MALPCKRPRLSTDNDDDDDKVVVVDVNDDDSTTMNDVVDVKVEKSLTPGDDDVKPCLTSDLESESGVVDLTVQCAPPGITRRNFSYTAEVIKARYHRHRHQLALSDAALAVLYCAVNYAAPMSSSPADIF